MKLLNEKEVTPLNKGEVMSLLKIVEQQVMTLTQLLHYEERTPMQRVYEDRLRTAKKMFNRLRELYNQIK